MRSNRENIEHTWTQMVELGPQMIHRHYRAALLDPRALYNPATTKPTPKC